MMFSRKNHSCLFASAFIVLLSLLCRQLHAYPSAEVKGAGGVAPPFDFGITGSLSSFLLIKDRTLAVSFAQTLKLIDVGRYALETDQPPALSSTDGTDGVIAGLAYDSSRDRILASQEDGDLLIFDRTKITAKPVSTTLLKGSKLGPLVVDTAADIAYVADNTLRVLYAVGLGNQSIAATIPLALQASSASFTVTGSVFNSVKGESYFSTSDGRIFIVSSGATVATSVVVDAAGKKNLSAIALFPAGSTLYALDATTPAVVRINLSSRLVEKSDINISANSSPTDIAIASVVNPSTVYAFVAGTGGISVIDTGNDTPFDLGSNAAIPFEPLAVSATPARLSASSVDDGNIYMGFSTGKVGLLSENPFVSVSKVAFSDGSTSLKQGGSVTLTFQSNQTGTYVVKTGGTVTGGGKTLVDSNGASGGPGTANTDTTVTIAQAGNSASLSEGKNDIWIFVTAGKLTGRRATEITVDTPPPDVVISSTGFGDGRIYVNFGRLTVSDLASYRIYVDTDATLVKSKKEVAATIAQALAGALLTGTVDGLKNGTTYYVAMDALDAGGNVSPDRTSTFSDGSVAVALPEETVGPAALFGEKGCRLIPASSKDDSVVFPAFFLLFAIGSLFFCRKRL